jgi:hypothetical protein
VPDFNSKQITRIINPFNNNKIMNIYSKYCPNVWVAKCDGKHVKGEIICVETKYGKINECIVWNLVREKDGFYYYSITRADGFNSQERAKAKADLWRTRSESHDAKATAAFEASNNAVKDTPFGQPIIVGHYSERRHRRAIETSQRNMDKMCREMETAKEQGWKADYWDKMADKIDLSMPESIEYFAHKLKQAKEYHEGVKSGKYPREHAYTLTYAKKNVNEMQEKYDTAIKLWGETDDAK